MREVDACVVGSGPNGLAAAVTMARAGLRVEVFEQHSLAGGGARTSELISAGHWHDICSAVHPMALASPFFTAFELRNRVSFIVPEISYGHGLTRRTAGIAYRDLDRTSEELGRDGSAWSRLFGPLVERDSDIVSFATDALLRVPTHSGAAITFGVRVLEQGSPFWNLRFHEDVAPAMLAGLFAHSLGRMPSLPTAGAGLLLGTLAHSVGWPIPIGGSQAIVTALIEDLERHGGVVHTSSPVCSLKELPTSSVVMLDTSASSMLDIAGSELPDRYRRAVSGFRYGNAASKVDFILSEPVPWADPRLRAAPTIHLGGTRSELASGEAAVAGGRYPSSPYVLLSQPSMVDPNRSPSGRHILWAYTHVPHGSDVDMTSAIATEIEKFAPGFRETIVASQATTADEYSSYNPNYIGGDFGSGAVSMKQLLKRPVVSRHPWRTPKRGLYLCSSSTPPGPGVHGMAGWHAARDALRQVFHLPPPFLGLPGGAGLEPRANGRDEAPHTEKELS